MIEIKTSTVLFGSHKHFNICCEFERTFDKTLIIFKYTLIRIELKTKTSIKICYYFRNKTKQNEKTIFDLISFLMHNNVQVKY